MYIKYTCAHMITCIDMLRHSDSFPCSAPFEFFYCCVVYVFMECSKLNFFALLHEICSQIWSFSSSIPSVCCSISNNNNCGVVECPLLNEPLVCIFLILKLKTTDFFLNH